MTIGRNEVTGALKLNFFARNLSCADKGGAGNCEPGDEGARG
jgi:hypothetical protein